MLVIESGITLNFPDDNYFRFEEFGKPICDGYKEIQHNFKVCDVCWYDQANDILYIIELKDWANGIVLNEEENSNYTKEDIEKIKKGITKHHIHELFKKSLDSVSMFISILLNTPYSTKIQRCSPFTITNTTKIKLLSIINWTNADTTYISNIHSAYKSYFKPYATLFGIRTYVVMTKDQAQKAYSWII
jgi:hypothetical protein